MSQQVLLSEHEPTFSQNSTISDADLREAVTMARAMSPTPTSPSSFTRNPKRLAGWQFFLTYSNVAQQSDEEITKDHLFHFFQVLSDEMSNELNYLVVAKEMHANRQSHHFHVLVFWQEKIKINDMRCWDFKGVHPNIAIVRNSAAATIYIHKDGDFIEMPLRVIEIGFDYDSAVEEIE